MAIEVLTVSPEGQLIIPKSILKDLPVSVGSEMMVYSSKDFIMIKTVFPCKEAFSKELDKVQETAQESGFTEEDISKVIKEVRARKRQKIQTEQMKTA